MDVKCVGLGYLPPDGDHAMDFYCTFSANDEDRFDVKGTDGPKGGTATVIGGSGKWQGATGSGTFMREASTETTGSSSFQLELSIP
jgi:hypothetical protein